MLLSDELGFLQNYNTIEVRMSANRARRESQFQIEEIQKLVPTIRARLKRIKQEDRLVINKLSEIETRLNILLGEFKT